MPTQTWGPILSYTTLIGDQTSTLHGGKRKVPGSGQMFSGHPARQGPGIFSRMSVQLSKCVHGLEMGQCVKCLLHKQENLRFIPRTHIRKPDELGGGGTCMPLIPMLGGKNRKILRAHWPANLAQSSSAK